MKKNTLLYIGVLLVFVACSKPKAVIPEGAKSLNEEAVIYPDYRDVVVPPNIAPLNLWLRSKAESYVVALEGKDQQLITAADGEGKIQFEANAWHALLEACKGSKVQVTVYEQRPTGWVSFKPYTFEVAREPIDSFLSYRLIEPGYELYRQMGLYQRNLTGFEEQTIIENNRDFSDADNHCVNCHNYQNYSARNMMFHVRANHGGTIICRDSKVEKVNIKNDSILSAGVYPTWHPTQPWIVYSTNKTGQAFHIFSKQKIEVVDMASDLVFYDVERNTVKSIFNTKDEFETFPAWNPAGDRIYYCSAFFPNHEIVPDSAIQDYILNKYDSLFYRVMSIPFDTKTRRFGTPEVEFDCATIHRSATVPRVSPDGRYLLFTLGDYGQFHIWHKSSDLWIKDLQNGEIRPLTEANSPDVDSYHTWSSNGRWIVFSSRRDDGTYTRPYITYFDRSGHAHKSFILPQEDPEQNIMLLKSYNVPELTRDAIPVSSSTFRKCIYEQEAKNATFEGSAR